MKIELDSMNKIETNGQTIWAIVDAMEEDKEMAIEILANNGIINLQPDKFYSLQNFLHAFNEIATEIGPKMLFKIGKAVLRNAKFPPDVNDIHKALSLINIAYHMNHKKDGQDMFDPSTGVLLDGIGNYIYQKKNETSGIMICNNPYPGEFDRGIISAMARKFEPLAEVTLDIAAEAHIQLGDSRSYLITW